MNPPADACSSQKREKRVQFFPSAYVKGCIHRKNYSNDEIAACWFKEEELKEFRKEFRNWHARTPGDEWTTC
jgi:hypothetical protein